MPRNVLQDVLPPKRKPALSVPSVSDSEREDKISAPPAARRRDYETRKAKPAFSRHSARIIWGIVTVSVVVLLTAVGGAFAGATITITPKSAKVTLDQNLTASRKSGPSLITYLPVSLEMTGEEIAPADSEVKQETRASGKIIIYNNYSTASQRLIKNTRFQTPNGLVYKIRESVTIPGRHVVNGKIVPGNVLTAVAAESAGEEYNIGLSDFSIPGFASNAERFKNFYARSKTPMIGGMIGTVKTLSEGSMVAIRAKLEDKLKQAILAEVRKKIPEGFVFYDSAYWINLEVNQPVNKSANDISVSEKASITAIALKKDDDLYKAIASKGIVNFDGSEVSVPDLNELTFTFKDPDKPDFAASPSIPFNLKGSATVVWQFDQNKLKGELRAKRKSDVLSIVSKYPAIAKAEVVLRPFWTRKFPKSADRIKIEIKTVIPARKL